MIPTPTVPGFYWAMEHNATRPEWEVVRIGRDQIDALCVYVTGRDDDRPLDWYIFRDGIPLRLPGSRVEITNVTRTIRDSGGQPIIVASMDDKVKDSHGDKP